MSILTRILSADELVKDTAKGVISGVDKAVYTNEEKADDFKNLLTLYEPFKLAQRLIALTVTGVYLLIHILIFALRAIDLFWFDAKNANVLIELATWNNDALLYPFLVILAFYFSGGVINSAVARFSKKPNKKPE